MNARFFSTKVVRLMFASLLACGLLALVALSLSGSAVNAAPLSNFGTDPQLRWITVTTSGGVVISDTRPDQAPASGSKIVYFSNFTAGAIVVTPDVAGSPPLTFSLSSGFTINTYTFITSPESPLNDQSITDNLTPLMGDEDIVYTATNNAGDVIAFTIDYVRDIVSPTGSIVSPMPDAVLTQSAQPAYTIVMAAVDGGSGIESVHVITGAGGAVQTGLTYNWTLPTEDNVPHTLLMTATDYVGNYVIATQSITVDTQAPTATAPWINGGVSWTPTSTLVFTWTPSADNAGILRYDLLITRSDGFNQQPAVAGATQVYTLTLASEGVGYRASLRAVDQNGNVGPWSAASPVITPDFHEPVIGAVTAPTNTSSSPIDVNWTASDSLAGIQSVTLWVQKLPSYTWEISTTTTTNATTGTFYYSPTHEYGKYDFYVQVADKAGNSMASPGNPHASTNYGISSLSARASAAVAYTNVQPLTITWIATSTLSNLSMITLCVSSTLSPAWQTTPIAKLSGEISQTTGVITYTPSADSLYYFAIGASTSTGQQLSCPPGSTGDVTITYDTQISATASLTVTPAGWTNRNPFTLTWSNPTDLSGIDNVKYLLGDTSPTSASVGISIGLTTTTVVSASDQGQNNLWLWVEDRAGNSGYTRAQSVTFQYDTISPTVALTLPKTFPAHQATVTWAGEDANSGLVSYTLAYLGSDNSSNSYTLPSTETAKTISVTYDKTYAFTLTAYDGAGNYTRTVGSVVAVLFKLPLPLVSNNYLNCISIDAESNNGNNDYMHAQSLTNWSTIAGGQKLTASGNFCPASATTSDDQIDYFKITPTGNFLTLKLTVPAGTNLNLYGYDQSGANLVFSAITPAGDKSVVVSSLPVGNGAPYYLEIRRMDAAFDQLHAQPYTLEVSDLKTLTNGSFEERAGNAVTDWTLSNAGLPAAPVTSVPDGAPFGTWAILLGNPALSCDSMPLGYAEAQQTFFVPNVSQSLNLKYRYIILTQDSVGSGLPLQPSRFDRFEVYVQNAAAGSQLVASDGNTVNTALSCNTLRRVPGPENLRPYDGAWAVNSVSLDAYKGKFVTVLFRNYSRYDNYYNTYTYLDKVELVSP